MQAADAIEKIAKLQTLIADVGIKGTDHVELIRELDEVKTFIKEFAQTVNEREAEISLFESKETQEISELMSFTPASGTLHLGALIIKPDGSVTVDETKATTISGDALDIIFAVAGLMKDTPIVYSNKIEYVEATSHPFFKPVGDNGQPIKPMTYATAKGTQEHLLHLFRFRHLNTPLGKVSEIFASLACWIVDTQPPSAERTLGLRALWDVKNLIVINRVPPGVG